MKGKKRRWRMKRIFRQIVHSIRIFFNRIIDNEAQRVFEFNSRFLN
jgi:hypothetical protein